MFMEERHRQILEKLKKRGRISVEEIQTEFDISSDSARRDLRILEQKNMLKRTHGGAVPIQNFDIYPNKKRTIKTTVENLEVYQNYTKIAETAAGYIEKDDVIYLTNSSIGFLMLNYLPRSFEYTVVVNSATLADELKNHDNLSVYITGGKMRMNSSTSIVDNMAVEFVSHMSFDKAFITCNGISYEFGVSAGTEETAVFQRAVIQNSDRKILLAPLQKIGQKAFIRVCGTDVFTDIITDSELDTEEILKLSDQGIKIIKC